MSPTSIPPKPRARAVDPLRVLALSSYPNEAAATRFRLTQYVAPLVERGIVLDVRPFLTPEQFDQLYRHRSRTKVALGLFGSMLRRARDVVTSGRVDAVLVQREAMLLGPPLIEFLISRGLGKPMVLDLDDATYLRYTSPTHGRLADRLKWFGKTDDLIRWARVVTCGNTVIADYVASKGTRATVIPTVVDTDLFRPRSSPERSDPPIIGWIGSHSTFPYLESIFPAIERLARTHRFRLRVVGSGRTEIRIPGVEVECRPWRIDREIEEFRSLDIGLYPIVEDAWSAGKSGFKSIQYLAVGVPFVVSPVGACSKIGESEVTHLAASSPDAWHEAIGTLLGDEDRRRRMGDAGRRHALAHYTVDAQADQLAAAIHDATGRTPDIERRPA